MTLSKTTNKMMFSQTIGMKTEGIRKRIYEIEY